MSAALTTVLGSGLEIDGTFGPAASATPAAGQADGGDRKRGRGRRDRRAFQRQRAIQHILFGVLHPLDIHVFTPEEFEETAYEALSFVWVIARQARIWHSTEEARRCVRSLFT